MQDCWKILGLYHTSDVVLIKKVYRELLKTYHPDKVQTEQEKHAYTIKCAQINTAYKEAVRQAKLGQFITYREGVEEIMPIPEDPWYHRVFYFFLILFLLFSGFLWLIYNTL